MAFPPAQPTLCWHKAELSSSLGPSSSSASVARRQWVDPFRTEVYSGEISVFCKISSAGMGINKETRLLPAPVLPSLLPWALVRRCAGSMPWATEGGEAARGMSHQVQSQDQVHPSWSLALQPGPPCSSLGWCFPPWSSVLQAMLASLHLSDDCPSSLLTVLLPEVVWTCPRQGFA